MLNYRVEQGWAKYGQREVKKARKYFYQSKSQQEATKASFIVAYNEYSNREQGALEQRVPQKVHASCGRNRVSIK